MQEVHKDDGDPFLYFGYGWNMLSVRLQRRTPSAVLHGRGHVAGRRLTFHKKSDDRSGKGDAEVTGNAVSRACCSGLRVSRSRRSMTRKVLDAGTTRWW
jgi:hypothetical protein